MLHFKNLSSSVSHWTHKFLKVELPLPQRQIHLLLLLQELGNQDVWWGAVVAAAADAAAAAAGGGGGAAAAAGVLYWHLNPPAKIGN